jgi:DNA-binding response OmpR family regulator
MTDKSKLEYLKTLTVLYADDDEVLLEYTRIILDAFFGQVVTARDGLEALEKYEKNEINIVILDNKMPHLGGLEVATKIRENDKSTPIFFATNHKDTEDLLLAVKLNLVDYLLKPVSLDTLQTTLFACIDRLDSGGGLRTKITKNIFYDNLSKCIIKDGTKISLTKKEYGFIEFLLLKKGAIATLLELEEIVWHGNMSMDTLRNLVSRLRQKIGEDIIVNIHNIGYKLV